MIEFFISLLLLIGGAESAKKIDFSNPALIDQKEILEQYKKDSKGLNYDDYKEAWYKAIESGGSVSDVLSAD